MELVGGTMSGAKSPNPTVVNVMNAKYTTFPKPHVTKAEKNIEPINIYTRVIPNRNDMPILLYIILQQSNASFNKYIKSSQITVIKKPKCATPMTAKKQVAILPPVVMGANEPCGGWCMNIK